MCHYQFTEKKMVNFSISFTFYMSPSYRFFQVFLLVSEWGTCSKPFLIPSSDHFVAYSKYSDILILLSSWGGAGWWGRGEKGYWAALRDHDMLVKANKTWHEVWLHNCLLTLPCQMKGLALHLQSFPLGGILGKLLINKLFFLGGLFQGLQKI